MKTNFRIKQSQVVAALGSAIAMGMGIGLAQAGGPIEFPGPPTAAIQITDSAGHTFTCMDNNPCDGDPLATGSVLVNHPIDGWVVNVDSGVSKNVIGSANSPAMDLDYNVVYHTGASQAPNDGTLTIMFSDTGFLPSPAAFLASIGGTLTSQIHSVTVTDYASSTDTLFALTTPICSMTFTKSPYGNSCTGKYTGATPYSITEVITITDTDRSNAQSSGDHSLTQAPEPGTLLLMGIALAGLGFVSRRRGENDLA